MPNPLSERHSVAIVIPAYNEERTIADVVEAFHRVMPDAFIVVVDNNSSDRTADRVRSAFAATHANGLLLHESRRGKANAVRRAFHLIDAEYYVMVDADMTYPAESIETLLEPLRQGQADLVVGDRHSAGHYARENKRPFHDFGNRIVRVAINRVFGTELRDILSGYRAFSRRFVKNYPVMIEGFELETDLTLHALEKRLDIVEIPISYADRPEGSHSKLNTVSDGMRVIYTIIHLIRHNRPLFFFGVLASVIGVVGLIAGAPPIIDYMEHGAVFHIPLEILASSLILVALLLLVSGLILESIAHFHRVEFELRLLNWSEGHDRR